MSHRFANAKWRRTIPLAVALFCATPTQADEIDDFVRSQLRSQNIPGLSLAVVKNGEIVKVEGYGLANVKLKIAATPETVYHIGSIGKQFVATGIMLLAQEGRLNLNDAIGKYLKTIPDAWQPITIRQLLTHTSGLVREEPGFDPFKDRNHTDVIKTAYRLPLRFAPGQKWEYSNTGYAVLAEILNAVTARPWPEYLSERVFRPSGMNTTYPVNTKEIIPNRARGYTDNDKLQEADDWQAFNPAGGFLSTVLDLAKWDAVLYSDRILTESSRREMWTPVTLNNGTTHPYGLGWELDPLFKGYKVVRHGGLLRGFRSDFTRLPEYGLTIITLMNSNDADWQTIVRRVGGLYLPKTPNP